MSFDYKYLDDTGCVEKFIKSINSKFKSGCIITRDIDKLQKVDGRQIKLVWCGKQYHRDLYKLYDDDHIIHVEVSNVSCLLKLLPMEYIDIIELPSFHKLVYNPHVSILELEIRKEGHQQVDAICRVFELLPNASVIIHINGYRKQAFMYQLAVFAPRDFTWKYPCKIMKRLTYSRGLWKSLAMVIYYLETYPDISKQIVYLLTKNG